MGARITRWVFLALLAALFVYMVIAAIGNLVLLPQLANDMGLTVNGIGWFWLVVGVAIPILALIIGLLVARKRTPAAQVLVLATALAVTAAVQLEILHLVPQSSFFS